MNKLNFVTLLVSFLTTVCNSYAFDIEDYATTYRATRDAYNKAYLENAMARSVMAQVMKLTGVDLVVDFDIPLTSQSGQGINTCDGMAESKNLRDRDTVVSELNSLLEDPRVLKVQDSPIGGRTTWDLKLFSNDVQSYYDQFNQSVFEEITDISKASPLKARAESVYKSQFDLEDYATTYRATRDAYFKSANELSLATGPYDAAKAAYAEALRAFYNFDGCADAGTDKSLEDVLADLDLNAL